tara:strand:- start:838 stop:1119 length:282 start_codon:yes stop_codon:yes gene_type:complete
MLNYLVIGLCVALLFAVIFFSIKPISMGIEARRNLKDDISDSDDKKDNDIETNQILNKNKIKISDEIVKLNNLKKEGLLSEEEFEKAKEKLLN